MWELLLTITASGDRLVDSSHTPSARRGAPALRGYVMSHYMQLLEKHAAAQPQREARPDPRLIDRPYYHLSTDALLEAIDLKGNAPIRSALIAELYARERK